MEGRIHVVAQDRGEDEKPPEPDHDAGNRGERLDECGDRAADPARGELAEKERDAERDRRGDEQRAERSDHSPEEEAAGAELAVNRVPGDGPDEAEPEGRDREPRPLDDLPGDQDDEHERAERGDPGDALQNQVAKTHPPPREGAAGCVSGCVERAHGRSAAILSYYWIFLICFLSNVTTGFGSGSKMSGGP